MPPAIIGGALALGGSVIGASAASKGAKKAADAQLQATQENNALQRETYANNKETLQPFINTGVSAGNVLNSLLGVSTPATTYRSGTPNYSSYVQSNPDLLAEYEKVKGQFGNDMSAFGQYHWNSFGQGENRTLPGTQVITTGGTGGAGDNTGKNAFSSFLGNTDYAYQSALGGQQVAGNYAGLGTLQSGAALKALQDRQNNINQGYLGNYMNALSGQQGVGLTGASALAGVGQNYASAVSQNNNNAANAIGNAALIKGNNNPLANALGVLGGGLFTSGLGSGGGGLSLGNVNGLNVGGAGLNSGSWAQYGGSW